jgi:hypothetical protein
MTQLEAGHKAEASGVYKVVHENNHVPRHYVTVVKGEMFPA